MLIAAVFFFASQSAATAQQISGNELLETCSSQDAVLGGFCIGYTLGVIDGQRMGASAVLQPFLPDADARELNLTINSFVAHCTPVEVTNSQLRDVITKYLYEHPETRRESARYLIWVALSETFPCNE